MRGKAKTTPEKLTESIKPTAWPGRLCLFHVSVTAMTQSGSPLLSEGPETAMLTA